MSWAHCGEDHRKRPVGYAVEATCDHPGCDARIDRGLAYVCGGEHRGIQVDDHEGASFVLTCGGYFCPDHRVPIVGFVHGRVRGLEVCASCAEDIRRHVGGYDRWPESYEPPTEGNER
jgi:hypothetical protein